MKNKILKIVSLLLLLALALSLQSCNKNTQESDTAEAQEVLNIRDDLAPEATKKVYESQKVAFTEGILDMFSVADEGGTRYKYKSITSAYVFSYEGDTSPCVALNVEGECENIPDVLLHFVNDNLIKTEIAQGGTTDKNSEFLFVKGSGYSLLRNYKDTDSSKYVQQMIFGFGDDSYHALKTSEYEIPYTDTSDQGQISKDLKESVDTDAKRFLNVESIETVAYSDVCVKTDIEEYLKKELDIDFGSMETINTDETTVEIIN